MLQRWKKIARLIKQDVLLLWFAGRDPRTPLPVKALILLTVAYAFSPIDLIPDFIPVLGYLDDLVLVPALVWLVLRLLPEPVRLESRQKADAWWAQKQAKPRSWLGAALIFLLWVLLALAAWRWWQGRG